MALFSMTAATMESMVVVELRGFLTGRKILAAAVGRTCRSVPVVFQFANPNVAVADRMIVVLDR